MRYGRRNRKHIGCTPKVRTRLFGGKAEESSIFAVHTYARMEPNESVLIASDAIESILLRFNV